MEMRLSGPYFVPLQLQLDKRALGPFQQRCYVAEVDHLHAVHAQQLDIAEVLVAGVNIGGKHLAEDDHLIDKGGRLKQGAGTGELDCLKPSAS
jgi:hypothetical protein